MLLTRKKITELLHEFIDDKLLVGFSYVEFLKHYVAKERALYTAMNTFRISGSVLVGKLSFSIHIFSSPSSFYSCVCLFVCLSGFGWIPSEKVRETEECLEG